MEEFSSSNILPVDSEMAEFSSSSSLPVTSTTENSVQQCGTTNLSQDTIPFVGQIFNDLEECYRFYTSYAYHMGFGVRKKGGKKKGGFAVYEKFVCSKQGVTVQKDKRDNATSRETTIRRTSCLAKLNVTKDQELGWRVTKFFDDHTHEMHSEETRHLIRGHRKISTGQRELIKHYNHANLKPYQQYLVLESQCGGSENIGCTSKDLQNCQRDERLKNDGHDAQVLLIYLENQKKINSGFVYVLDVDEETNTLKGLFWSDARSRVNHTYFGDSVVMDATYQTNKYSLILVTIAGINHHMQTVVFGSALISKETAETYVWVLETWLASMPTSTLPKMIITDQDGAMAIAIKQVMPDTFHRLCMWHILKKFQHKLSAEVMRKHYQEFKKCIKKSETKFQFEITWQALLDNTDTRKIHWMNDIFDIRARWIPVYCNHIFSAGMSSSQRVESSHSFIKRFVSVQNSLIDFMVKFDTGMKHQRDKEDTFDFNDKDQEHKMQTRYKSERQMSEVYTMTAFRKFREQLMKSQEYLVCTLTADSDKESTYTVSTGLEGNEKSRTIIFDKTTDMASCSCSMFNFKGITCCHQLFFYQRRGMPHVPQQYILERWTKKTKSTRMICDGAQVQAVENRDVVIRHMNLCKQTLEIANMAALTTEATDLMSKELEKIREMVKMMSVDEDLTSESAAQSESSAQSSLKAPIKDPVKARTKGCGRGGRIKDPTELYTSRVAQRQCHTCMEYGHNSRTCQKKKDK